MTNRIKAIANFSSAAAYAFGFTAVGAIVLGILISSLLPWIASYAISETVQIQPDGTPLIMSYPRSDYSDQSFRTLDGHQVKVKPNARWLGGAGLTLPQRGREHSQATWGSRILSANDERRPAGYWYFVYEPDFDERGYFVGIDSRTRRTIGFMGVNGFTRTVPSRDEQFFIARYLFSNGWGGGLASAANYNSGGVPEHTSSDGSLAAFRVFLVSDKKLLEVNLQERTVRSLLESDDLQSIAVITRGTMTQSKEGDEVITRRPKQYLAVRYPDRVDLVDPMSDDPSQAVSYLIPESMQISNDARGLRSNLSAFLTERETLIFLATLYPTSIEDGTTYRLTSVEAGGAMSKTEEFELGGGDSNFAWLTLAPPVFGTAVSCFVGATMAQGMVSSGIATGYAEALTLLFEFAWPAFGTTIISSCVAVWLCYRRQRRYGIEGGAGWLVFSAIFGLPGLLGYLWSQPWPPLVPCPDCGKLASQAYENCHVCGEEFAPPHLLGNEVFA